MLTVNCGKNVVVQVDETRFNDDVNAHVFTYGLKQMLSDAHVSIKKDEHNAKSKATALVNKKLAALYKGEFRTITHLDRVEAEARGLARLAIGEQVLLAGRKLNSLSTDWWATQLDANWENFKEEAEKIVAVKDASKKEAKSIKINLEDLGL